MGSEASVPRLALLFFAASAACRPAGVVATGSTSRLDPSSLDFGTVTVGRRATLPLVIVNEGRASRTLTISLEGDGYELPAALELPGGGQTEVLVAFAPLRPGASAGLARFVDAETTLELSLRGLATEAPTCPRTSLPCRTLEPDEQGACVERPDREGLPCEQPCIENGRCLSGVCVGAARRCDDGDACTTDRCSEERGCVFDPLTCPAPGDPCRAASCDPTRGCLATEVKDGTSCGPNDCVTARVCLSGQCRSVTAPEGSTCAEGSFCQPAGSCRGSVCVRPPAAPLQPVWSATAPTGSGLIFPGVADGRGNLYWLTTRRPPTGEITTLVSVDSAGRARFSVDFAGVPLWRVTALDVPASPMFLISDAQLAIKVGGGPDRAQHRLEVRSTTDGALQWSRSRPDFVGPLGVPAGAPLYLLGAGTVGVPARLWLNLRTNTGGANWLSWLAVLDPLTGALLWQRRGTYFDDAIADDEAIYVRESLTTTTLWSWSATGQLRWQQDGSRGSATLSSLWDRALLTAYPPLLRDAATGLPQRALDGGLPISPWTLRLSDRVISVAESTCRGWVTMHDPLGRERPTAWEPGRCFGEPLLTSRGTLLVGLSSPPEVREIALDGGTLFACPLQHLANGPAVLVGSRWITWDRQGGVHAVDVPVPGPAPRGWVTAEGSAARARRPAN